MTLFREYLQPETIDQAIKDLTQAKGKVAVIAGGTDLLLDLRQGRHESVDQVVDISGVEEMSQIEIRDDMVYLGASVTHKQIITSPILDEHARCVVEGCGLIGGPQVRNVATIGGNVSHALPAGDGTISLLALDTEVELAGLDGRSWSPLIDLFAGPGKVHFDRSKQIVVGFRFRTKAEREASAFHRVMRPQGVAIAILNMAAWLRTTPEGKIDEIRISVGPAGPKPFRAFQTEDFLRGGNWDDAAYQKAAEILGEEVSLRTSAHRATKEYRHHILPVLLKEVIDKAYQQI